MQGEATVAQVRLVAAELMRMLGFGTYFEVRAGTREREIAKEGCGTLGKL